MHRVSDLCTFEGVRKVIFASVSVAALRHISGFTSFCNILAFNHDSLTQETVVLKMTVNILQVLQLKEVGRSTSIMSAESSRFFLKLIGCSAVALCDNV